MAAVMLLGLSVPASAGADVSRHLLGNFTLSHDNGLTLT